MVSWDGPSRHWSHHEGYATGDVLLDMVDQGWAVVTAVQNARRGRARLYEVTLRRGAETVKLPVLDCPAVHQFTYKFN